jgi:hypothetical protein
MAKRNTPGNALVAVLLLASLMAVVGILAIKSVSWASDLNYAVYQQEKQFRFAQGILDCGISKATRDFDLICKGKKTITGSLQHHDSECQLIIEPKSTLILIACNVLSGRAPTYTLTAELTKDSQSIVRIQGFQR